MTEGVSGDHSQSHRWWCQSNTIGTPHCWLRGSRSRTEKAEGQSSFSTVSRFLQSGGSSSSAEVASTHALGQKQELREPAERCASLLDLLKRSVSLLTCSCCSVD